MSSKVSVENFSNNIGVNISRFSNLQVIDAEDAEILAGFIRSIKSDFEIVSICVKNARFYAFINCNCIIKKNKKEKIK